MTGSAALTLILRQLFYSPLPPCLAVNKAAVRNVPVYCCCHPPVSANQECHLASSCDCSSLPITVILNALGDRLLQMGSAVGDTLAVFLDLFLSLTFSAPAHFPLVRVSRFCHIRIHLLFVLPPVCKWLEINSVLAL